MPVTGLQVALAVGAGVALAITARVLVFAVQVALESAFDVIAAALEEAEAAIEDADDHLYDYSAS